MQRAWFLFFLFHEHQPQVLLEISGAYLTLGYLKGMIHYFIMSIWKNKP